MTDQDLQLLKRASSPAGLDASDVALANDLARLALKGLLVLRSDNRARITAAGLALLAREGVNTWEEDQERRQDWHSDVDPQ